MNRQILPTALRARSALILAAAAGLLALPTHLAAQTQPNSKAANAAAVQLADEPFRLDSVGLSMHLPLGALAQTTRIGEQSTVQITPPDSSWLITIQTPQSKDKEMTVSGVADTVMRQLLGSYGVLDPDNTKILSTEAKVLAHEKNLTINDQTAERFYIEAPANGNNPPVIRGYTVFRTAPGRFVAFDLVVPKPEFAKARRAYETSIATATFVDPADLAAARGAAIEAGAAIFARLATADYEAVIDAHKERWYRLYRPAPTGADADAEEIAYRRVRAWKGFRGELDLSKDRSGWKAADHQQGYLVRIDSRYIFQGQVVDSVGIYFLSPDRNEEAWTLKMGVRGPRGSAVETTTETGARSGSSMTISTAGTGRPGEIVKPVVPPHGYISQLESFLLPQLLIHAGVAADYGFYAYQSAHGNVRIRRDSLIQAGDKGGVWQIRSKADEDRAPQVSTYNERGELIRAQLPDGSAWEPIEFDRLVSLWRSKGMPMD